MLRRFLSLCLFAVTLSAAGGCAASRVAHEAHSTPEENERMVAQAQRRLAQKPGDPAAMRWSGIEITRRDGDKRIIEARNIPLFKQGLMISTVSDITPQTLQQEELRQLERKYHRAQMLESVGRLAGGIAHDFNNLLTVISSYAELAAASAAVMSGASCVPRRARPLSS